MADEEGRLSFVAGMDDSDFVRGANNIRETIHETAKDVKQTGMTIDEFTGQMTKLLGAFDKMTAAVNKNTQAHEQTALAGKKAGEEEKRGADKATEAIEKTTDATKDLGEEFEKSSGIMAEGMDKLTKYAAGFLTLQAGKDFIQKVTSIRGEFQKLEVAFTTMLGSGERAQQLMQELTRTAAITPFDLKGVADGAKQLLAYGVAAENVNDTLIHLGDIAAGLSIPLGDLVMLYGTTMTQGRMFTQDLRQFMGRGIPLAEELAKQFGVTKDKVGELVTAGKVGAEEFNKAIMSMSSEGGKFAGLMEAQSHTIAGQISNIEDAIDTMFNEIGKSNEGIINDVLGSVSYLVENYKKVGAVLMDAVVAIGLYKTALITAHAIEKTSIAIKQAMAVQEALLTAEAKKLAAARGISIAAAKAELGSVNVLTVAKMRLTAATKALTASMLANPYTAVAVALAAVAFGVYKLATAEGVETAARRRANEEMQTFADKLDEQQNKIKGYIQTIQDETATEYQKAVAWEMLNKMAPTLTEKYDKATIATLDLAEATKELNEQADKANYDHIRSEVQKWEEAIERINQNMLDDARYTGGKNAIFNLQQLAGAEAQLDTYLKKLSEIDRIRKKMAEDAKPLEIRIKEANENVQAKQAVYDFYKRAADLAGELKNAHDVAAGTIANSNIPLNYEQIADDTREKYDSLIAELEADVEELRTKVAESPADIRLQIELEEKQKCLNDILDMKKQWAWSGVTTIPINFVMNFSQVETSLQNAKNGQGINTEGMRFNGPTGTWVKDEATAPEAHTAAQWRKDAYNNWKQAQAAVDAFWNKKEEMDKATFDKEYKALKDAADQAKKDYDKLKGDSSRSNAAKKAAETARQHQAYLDLIEKNKVERERAATDLEFSTEQATIDAMEDGTEKTLRQLELNFKKQKEEIERGYQDLKQAKIEEARKLWEANPANKNSVFDASTVNTDYTEEEKANYAALMEACNATYRRALDERRRMEAQAMLDYLKEYGSIAQQKYAIEKEYNEKIAKEQDEWRKKQLEAEKKSRLSQMSAQNIAQSIDWQQTFSGVGNVLEDIAKNTLKKVEEYMKSTEFKALSAQDKKAYSDLRNQLIDAGGTSSSNPFSKQTWDEIGEAAKRYRNSIQVLNDANETAEDIRKRLNAAEAEAAANPADLRLQEVVTRLQESFEEISETVENAEAEVADAQSDLKEKTDSMNQGMGDFQTILGQITSGSLSGFALAVGNIIKKISGDTDKVATDFGALFGEAGKQIGGLVGAILQIIDILGTEPAKFIDDLLTKIADVLEAILSQLPEIIVAAIKGVGNIIGGVFTGIGGLFAGLFGGGADWSAYEAAMDKWGHILDSWESNLKYERELMEKAYGKDAIDVSEKALKVLEDTQKAAAEIYRGWAGSGAGWFSHSNGYNVNDDTSWRFLWQYDPELAQKMGSTAFINPFTRQMDYTNGDVSRLFDLTWQELEKLKNEAPQFWNSLHGEAQKYLDQYIEAGKAAEETIAALNEQLTTTTKEDVFDDFLNSLYELADGSEDVFDNIAENWQKMVNRMVINNLIAKDFQQKLESWYADLAKLQSDYNSGKIDERTYKSRLEALKSTYLGYLTDAEKQVNQFTEWGIIKPIEEAVEEVTKEYFSGLRESWLDTLTDMEADVESWKREIQRVMFEDLVNEFILGDDFNTWLENWKNAYKEALEAGDEQRLTQLLEEQVRKREELAGKAQQLADGIGYEKLAEEAENAFSDIRSSLLDTLMDMDADAESWGEKIRETLLREMVEKTIVESMGLGELMETYGAKLLSYITDESLTDAQRQQNIDDVLSEMEEAFGKASELVQKMRDALGIGKKEEAPESPFKDLRDQFLSTLMDMEGDAEDFRKNLNKILTQQLIEKFILNDDFDKYLEDWNQRYMDILNDGNKTQEEIEAALDAMIEELVAKRELTLEQAEKLRDRLVEVEEEMPDTTFSDMTDSWISALMDLESTGEQWAEEIGRTMARKIIEQMVAANMIQPLLDNLQNAFNEAMGAEGATWQSVLPQMAPYIEELKAAFGDLQPIVEQILNALGIFREEVEEEAKEGFGDLRGTFVSALMDMEKDAEQFGRDIARAMTEQMISALIEQQFSDQLAAINEAWFNALEAGDTAAMEKIRQQLIELYSVIGDAVKPLLDTLAEIEYVPEEVEEEIDETITSMRDDFLSALMDMKSGTQDFVNDIRKLLTQKLVEKFVLNSVFDSWLQGMQSQYDAIFNGSMNEEQAAAAMNRLAAEWEAKAKEMQEQTQAIFDLTGWTAIVEQMNSPLADLRSSFVSALMDMESDAQDFANDIAKILTEAFIDRFVLGEEFDKRLAEWQEQYAAIMKGNYSEEERALLLKNLQAAITAAKEGYAEEAQAIHDLMGTGNAKDQTATMNMADKATYDQFETYLGIAVAQQMAMLQGNEVRLQILATLQAMTGITSPNGDTVKEIRTMLNTTNEYLLDIKRSNRSILNLFGEKLDTIITRLQGLI